MTDGSPPTASDRIAAIRAAMTDDAEAAATFAEPVRLAIEDSLRRLDAASGGADHAEAALLLAHVRERVSGLDPARLTPRRGLAGLFDGRGKRLKAFRAAYASVADAAASSASELADRAAALARRGETLETLWHDLRGQLTALDDHLAAGCAWLADRATPTVDPVPPEAAAAFEDTPADSPGEDALTSTASAAPASSEVDPSVSETASLAASGGQPVDPPEDTPAAALTVLPHPLEARLEVLDGLRPQIMQALPRIRALQNADHAVPAVLASARDRIEAWRSDWREALGLTGKRPRKVSPDPVRLLEGRDSLIDHLVSAERAVATATTRLGELATRREASAPVERIAA